MTNEQAKAILRNPPRGFKPYSERERAHILDCMRSGGGRAAWISEETVMRLLMTCAVLERTECPRLDALVCE